MKKMIGSTIAMYRKARGLSQITVATELARYGIHVTSGAVSTWEKDTATPNVYQFLCLCKLYGIQDIYTEFIGLNTSNPFSGLTDEGIAKAQDYIELLLASGRYSKNVENIIPFVRKLPVSILTVSAGTGFFLDEENFEEVEVGQEVPMNASFGLHISGDSMEPRFHDGQLVWIEKTNSLKDGEVGIFYLDGMTYCKKLKEDDAGLSLISLNPKYSPIRVSPESAFQVFGRVLQPEVP